MRKLAQGQLQTLGKDFLLKNEHLSAKLYKTAQSAPKENVQICATEMM